MQNLKNINYILFDLDGTLTDSYPAITTSFLYAAAEYSESFTEEELSSIIGPPLKDSFMRLLHIDAFEAWERVHLYRKYYNAGGMYNCKVYAGIEETLNALNEQGKILAVATSKPEEQAIKVLSHFGLDRYFKVIAGDDQNCTRGNKKLVIEYCLDRLGVDDRSLVAMVGDRRYDIEGAKESNITSIGVAYGYGSTKELKEANADYIVNTAMELKELF